MCVYNELYKLMAFNFVIMRPSLARINSTWVGWHKNTLMYVFQVTMTRTSIISGACSVLVQSVSAVWPAYRQLVITETVSSQRRAVDEVWLSRRQRRTTTSWTAVEVYSRWSSTTSLPGCGWNRSTQRPSRNPALCSCPFFHQASCSLADSRFCFRLTYLI